MWARLSADRRVLAAAVCIALSTFVPGSTVVRADDVSGRGLPGIARQEEPLKAYRALRHMHAWSDRFNQEAWLDAWTELKGGRFEFQIVEERGSDTIRSKVLHPILERERDLINSGDGNRADLTAENYDFSDASMDAVGRKVVQMKTRRKDVLLVDGRMVLSPDGHELLRVEGRLAKNPSFWTSLVNIVRRYARLAGVRVPVATETTAKVKFAGTSQLRMSYEYESVNGRPVNLSAQR
jgi:hypothetical protein